jgi:hypothetical protein
VLAIGFYLMLLAPKRQKASELNDQIDQLRTSISQQQQVASFAEQARRTSRATTAAWSCSARPSPSRQTPDRCSCS